MKRLRAVSVAALLALAVGCGDDGGDSSATTVAAPATSAAQPAATTAPSTEPAPLTGTLVVGVERDPERLDPNFSRHVTADTLGHAIFDALLFIDAEGRLVPSLATDFTFTDNLTLEMTLREGVVFHNGEPFTAESVKVSVERMQNPDEGSHLLPQFSSIDAVEIVDDYRVVLKLNRAAAPLLQALTRLAMVPPAYYAETGQQAFERAPVGTGPFKFVEYVNDDRTVVEANTEYWGGSPKGMPMVERVIFRVLPEATTRIAELTTGGIHIASAVPVDQRVVVEGAGMTNIIYNDGRALQILINATEKGAEAEAATGATRQGFEALTDPRVRQALNYAIDRETVVKFLFEGNGTPLGQPFAPTAFGHNPSNEPYSYDPAKARELLAAAGYPNGFTVKMLANNTANTDELTAIMSNFSQIGVNIELEIVDSAVANERILGGVFAPLRYGPWNQPETFLDLLIKCEGLVSVYCNEDVDALIAEQATTLDPAARDRLIWKITDILREDAAAVWLWSSTTGVGVNDKQVTGFTIHARGWIPVTNATVAG
jgi:peptide/nickel transport system substrate-binding protein